MGRKKKYMTEEEKKEANRKAARDYYRKNADKVKEKRMKRYYNDGK